MPGNTLTKVIIKLPFDTANEFTGLWKELRIAEGLDGSADLKDAVTSDNFDGGAVTAWVITLTPSIVALVPVILGFLIAKRGEIEIKNGEKSIRMKNIKPSQAKDFMASFYEHLQ